MPTKSDVRFSRLEDINWTDENKADSIQRIFDHAINHASAVIEWYLTSKKGKKNCAQQLRLGAIFLGTLGGLFPIVASAIGVNGVWATVFLGLSAMCIAIDRFFGCSNAWMRFITAEHKVRRNLHEFQITCQQLKASWPQATPSDDDVQNALGATKTFITSIEDIVLEETAQWRSEFQNAIKELDNALKQTAKK